MSSIKHLLQIAYQCAREIFHLQPRSHTFVGATGGGQTFQRAMLGRMKTKPGQEPGKIQNRAKVGVELGLVMYTSGWAMAHPIQTRLFIGH
jgi:hypothetical protein